MSIMFLPHQHLNLQIECCRASFEASPEQFAFYAVILSIKKNKISLYVFLKIDRKAFRIFFNVLFLEI